jgi:hypothetical protein
MAGYPGTQLVDDEAKERFRRVVGDARTHLLEMGWCSSVSGASPSILKSIQVLPDISK